MLLFLVCLWHHGVHHISIRLALRFDNGAGLRALYDCGVSLPDPNVQRCHTQGFRGW